MFYQMKRILGYISVLALLNSSFYPLYANKGRILDDREVFLFNIKHPGFITKKPLSQTIDSFFEETQESSPSSKSTPPAEPEKSDQGYTLTSVLKTVKNAVQGIPGWLLEFENTFQEPFVKASFEFIEELTPEFLTNLVSWLGEDIPESRDTVLYFRQQWQENFKEQVEELKKNGVKQAVAEERLRDLRDMVWDGYLSPQVYEKGLDYLNNFKPLVQKLKTEFRNDLKKNPALVTKWFEDDLFLILTRFHQHQFDNNEGIKIFNSVSDYYRGIQNALDYTETLVTFRQFIQKSRHVFNLDDETYWALNQATVQAVKNRDENQYKLLKRTQAEKTREVLKLLDELPSYDPSFIYNSSLPTAEETPKAEETKSTTEAVKQAAKKIPSIIGKGLIALAKGGMAFKEDPVKAASVVLLAQVTAAAALKTVNPIEDKQGQSKSSHYTRRQMGNEIQISQNSTQDNLAPVIAPLSNETAIFAWKSGANMLKARFYSLLNRTFIGNEFQVNEDSNSNIVGHSAAGFVDGGGLLVWSNETDILGQAFFANRSFHGNNFVMNQNRSTLNQIPFAVGDPSGGAYVLWQRNNTNWDIAGRGINSNLSFKNNEAQLNNVESGDQLQPSGVFVNNRTLLASWAGIQTGIYEIYGSLFDMNPFSTLTGDFDITGLNYAHQLWPSLSLLSTGNILASWGGGQSGNNYVYDRVLYPNGTLASNITQVNVLETLQNTVSYSVPLGNGGLVFWQGHNLQGTYNIYGSYVDMEGQPSNDQVLVSEVNSATYYAVKALRLGNNQTLVVYNGNPSGAYHAYLRIVDDQEFLPQTQSPSSTPTSSPSTAAPSSNSTGAPSTEPTNFSGAPSSSRTSTTSTTSESATTDSEQPTSPWIMVAEYGIPSLVGAGLIGGGVAYGCKKKRRGILVASPKDIEMQPKGPTTPYGQLSQVMDPHSIDLTTHYENVSAIHNQGLQPNGVNQYTSPAQAFGTTIPSHHPYENVGGVTNPSGIPNGVSSTYEGVSNVSSNSTGKPYASFPSEQKKGNPYDNVPKGKIPPQYVNVPNGNSMTNPYKNFQ